MKIALAEQIGHLDETIAEIGQKRWGDATTNYRMQKRIASLEATRVTLVWLMNHRDVAEAAASNETERRLG